MSAATQAQFVQQNLAAGDRPYSQASPTAFTSYDVYFTLVSAAEAPNWKVWENLTGSMPWTPNMGSLGRTVTPERSPVVDQQPRPQNVTSAAKRNVYGLGERTEDFRIKHHKFESDQIHFLGPWQDVRSNQLDPVLKDVTRQQSIYADHFTRENAWQRAPYIYVCGYAENSNLGNDNLVEAPNTKDSADAIPKTAAFLTELANSCKGNLTLRDLDLARVILKNDLGAIPFTGGAKNGQPLKNDLMQGTFAGVVSDEAWNNFKWSDQQNYLKSISDGYVFKRFQGRLFGDLDCIAEQYPLRMNGDGSFPNPEIADDNGFTRPNPDYINAKFEFAWLCGDDFGASVQVGPPPKDFGSGKVKEGTSLVWNGKPFLTSRFLVKDGDGNYEMNETYGEFRKVIARSMFGYAPKRALSMIPILYVRSRVNVRG